MDAALLLTQAADERVVAIGETGLDYFYSPENKEVQQASFREHIRVARALNKPSSSIPGMPSKTPCRSCAKRSRSGGRRAALFHRIARDGRGRHGDGLYISISGIATFKNASALQAVVKALPLERLLIETDSPYLAPVPHRGGRTSLPSYETSRNLLPIYGRYRWPNWQRPPATISLSYSSWLKNNPKEPRQTGLFI